MTEDIDKHVLKKYEIAQKLGKGVRYTLALLLLLLCLLVWARAPYLSRALLYYSST